MFVEYEEDKVDGARFTYRYSLPRRPYIEHMKFGIIHTQYRDLLVLDLHDDFSRRKKNFETVTLYEVWHQRLKHGDWVECKVEAVPHEVDENYQVLKISFPELYYEGLNTRIERKIGIQIYKVRSLKCFVAVNNAGEFIDYDVSRFSHILGTRENSETPP
jgi:hypothetical protein